MNNNYKKQSVKILGFALVALAISFQAKAQKTTAIDKGTVIKNVDAPAFGNTTAGLQDGTVRLVDNKGTIKYLQVKNGLTAITNKANDNTGVTTTWQLGGVLTDNTYITAGNNAEFALNGLQLVNATVLPSTTAGDRTSGTASGTASGWTVLIRDEATGATQKIKASDLLQVQAGQNVAAIDATFIATPTYTISANAPNDYSKVSVYRNGAKLVANSDYTYVYTSATASGVVELKPTATAYGEWALFVGDVIEIQWVK